MTPAEYLQKYPKARASTIANRIKCAAKTAELREEMKPKGWALPKAFRAVAQAFIASALGRR